MRKAILIGIIPLVLTLVLLPACAAGVPQEEYTRVSSDLAAAQTQIQSLEGDLSAKESELAAAQTEIQSLQDELSTKDTELSAKESELEVVKGKLEQGKATSEILNAIFIPAMTGELDEMTEAEAISWFLEFRDKVIAVGDPTLTAKFEAMLETFSDEAFMSFFMYLMESIPKTLE